jgi:hypothetical protein
VRDKGSIEALFQLLQLYSRASGSKINREKTAGTLLGPLKHDPEIINMLKWSKEPVKALGVNHGREANDLAFWFGKIDQLKKKLCRWKHRKLTFKGKVHLIKSVGFGIFHFAWCTKIVPEVVTKTIEKEMWSFVWDGKVERVNRDVCRKPVAQGGLGVPNVSQMIKNM